MSPQLPVELLRLVIDNLRLPPLTSNLRTRKLEREFRSSLYSLSLTTRVLNEIAQPLLYEFVRIPFGRTIETLSLLVGDEDEQNDSISAVRTMVFAEEENSEVASVKEVARLLREVPRALSSTEQLITSSDLWSLDKFHGSSSSVDPPHFCPKLS